VGRQPPVDAVGTRSGAGRPMPLEREVGAGRLGCMRREGGDGGRRGIWRLHWEGREGEVREGRERTFPDDEWDGRGEGRSIVDIQAIIAAG